MLIVTFKTENNKIRKERVIIYKNNIIDIPFDQIFSIVADGDELNKANLILRTNHRNIHVFIGEKAQEIMANWNTAG